MEGRTARSLRLSAQSLSLHPPACAALRAALSTPAPLALVPARLPSYHDSICSTSAPFRCHRMHLAPPLTQKEAELSAVLTSHHQLVTTTCVLRSTHTHLSPPLLTCHGCPTCLPRPPRRQARLETCREAILTADRRWSIEGGHGACLCTAATATRSFGERGGYSLPRPPSRLRSRAVLTACTMRRRH